MKRAKKNDKQRDKTTHSKPIKSSDTLKPIWMFDMIDKGGKFAFDVLRDDFNHKEVLDKMIHYSTMTWADIKQQTNDKGKSKHHFIGCDSISKDAIDRIHAKKLDEFSDMIFSFAFQNKLRIIGIRSNQCFHVLWYDPNHEVCPYSKKHT